jgi:hypothetical protein
MSASTQQQQQPDAANNISNNARIRQPPAAVLGDHCRPHWRQDEDGWWLLTLTSDVCRARSTNRKPSMTGELTLKQRFKVRYAACIIDHLRHSSFVFSYSLAAHRATIRKRSFPVKCANGMSQTSAKAETAIGIISTNSGAGKWPIKAP